MFAVLFEVRPEPAHHDDYIAGAQMLAPEVQALDGFLDNVRYRSLTKEGWLLSLSFWRDEKAVVRWRIRARHHEMQRAGREAILADYRLRVGELTADSAPKGPLVEQRLDETQVAEAKTVTLIHASRPAGWVRTDNPYDCAEWLGLNPWAAGAVGWDVYEALGAESDLVLCIDWESTEAALAYEETLFSNYPSRQRRLRIVRTYAKYDRREATQYFPDAAGAETIHD